MVKEDAKGEQNITEISRLLDDAGLEIVSLNQRFLDAEETFFLRNRIISSATKQLEAEAGLGFTRPQKESSIKTMGQIDVLNMTNLAQANPLQLAKVTKLKEKYMRSLRESIAEPTPG